MEVKLKFQKKYNMHPNSIKNLKPFQIDPNKRTLDLVALFPDDDYNSNKDHKLSKKNIDIIVEYVIKKINTKHINKDCNSFKEEKTVEKKYC